MTTPEFPDELSPEAIIVLEAIGEVRASLASAKESQEGLREELKKDARDRIKLAARQVIAVIVAVALVLIIGATAYVQYDRVTRCHVREDTIKTIKRVLAKDHEALPNGLLKGFGDNEDTARVVAVIRASYDQSERQIDILLPEPDCTGFLP